MSYANGTQFYNLPQTVGTDKRDWFDTNSAFAAVDAALHAAVMGQAADAEAIATLQADVASNTSDIASLQATTATHTSQIATLANGVQENAVNISDVRNDVEDMITAYNEASATSTHAYAVGDFFIYNNVLYKATSNINVGDTIVPDTNCTTTNVSTELGNLPNVRYGRIFTKSYPTTTLTWGQIILDFYNSFTNSSIYSELTADEKDKLILDLGGNLYYLVSKLGNTATYTHTIINNNSVVNQEMVFSTSPSFITATTTASGTTFTQNKDTVQGSAHTFSIII